MRAMIGLLLAGCGSATTASPTAIGNRGAASATDADVDACGPTAVVVMIDLDGDSRADTVRMVSGTGDGNDAIAMGACLDIVATSATRLHCDGHSLPILEQVTSDSHTPVAVTGIAACNLGNARLDVMTAGNERNRAWPSVRGATVAEAAIRIDGGDAAIAIAWGGNRWRWIELGY